jgi:DNA-binding CsgD family transcriptional regulator
MTFSASQLASRAFDTVCDMKSSLSAEDLDDVAAAAFGAIDLPSFALAEFFQADMMSNTKVIAGRFEPGWASRYIEKGYGRSCQIAREMTRSSRPYSWNDVIANRGLDDVQARIWNEARDFGLRDGLFTPMRWGNGSYAAVVIAGRDANLLDPLLRITAEVLSAYYCAEARRLQCVSAGSRARLSSRQRECLAWVRHGKSSAEIGDILGISAQTVDEHIAEACRKLGVRTRVQAAVEASLQGIIDGSRESTAKAT